AGAEIRDVSLPHTEHGVGTYYVLATAEASSNLSRYDGVRYGYRPGRGHGSAHSVALVALYTRSRPAGFGAEVMTRARLRTSVRSSGYYDAYYGRGRRVRSLIRQDFEAAFEEVDVLLTPATPAPPFRLGSKINDPLEMYLGDVYTVNANL